MGDHVIYYMCHVVSFLFSKENSLEILFAKFVINILRLRLNQSLMMRKKPREMMMKER